MGEGFTGLDDLLDALEEKGNQVTKAVVEKAEKRGIETTAAVRRGNPPDDILSYAEDNGTDVIVKGTHGRTGVKRALLESVIENVVRHSDIPVCDR